MKILTLERTARLVALFLGFALLAPVVGSAQADSKNDFSLLEYNGPNTPKALILFAYKRLVANQWDLADPSQVGVTPRSITNRWFTSGFIRDLEKDAECWENESEGVGQLWYEGQDFQITRVNVSVVSATQNQQMVRVSFKNFDIADTLDFKFARVDGNWLIDDVIRSQATAAAPKGAHRKRIAKNFLQCAAEKKLDAVSRPSTLVSPETPAPKPQSSGNR